MTWIVLCAHPRRPYLAGVFAGLAAAERYCLLVPAALRPSFRVVESAVPLPCFLIENAGGLRLATVEQLETQLHDWAAEPGRPDDWVYGNVYGLKGEWTPGKPGRDDMGVLPHTHVERAGLELHQSSGVAGFLSSWLADR